MPIQVLIDSFDSREWDENARRFSDYSVYQNEKYQGVRAEVDRQELMKIMAVDDRGDVVMMGHARIKSAQPLPFQVGYMQSGPLVLRDGNLHAELEDAFRAMRQACHARGIQVLRIVPNAPRAEIGEKIEKAILGAGFAVAPTVAPYHTILVSLKETEDEIRARIDRESRRVLRKSEAAPVEVLASTGQEAFDVLERLYAAAKVRKGFLGLDSHEFATMQQRLDDCDKAVVLLARHEGEYVTAHATTHFGKMAVPILTANNETGLRLGTSYLLWWKAYCMAKELGMEYYDLGGVDPEENPKGYLFKKRLGGEETRYIGGYDSCSNVMVRGAWAVAEKSYRFLKDWRKDPA